MTASAAERRRIEELSYRELQAELKQLKLPATGPTEVLKERLSDARGQSHGSRGSKTVLLSPEKTTVKSPTIRRTRQKKEPELGDGVKSETYVVTTEVSPGTTRKSRAEALRISSQEALPDGDVRVEPLETAGAILDGTPLEKVKRLARKSAGELQKSVTGFQKRIGKRRLGWIWPTLAALLLALLVGSQWRHTAYWQRQLNSRITSEQPSTIVESTCRDDLQHTMGAVYEASQVQATRLGRNLQGGLSYVQDGVASGASTVSTGALGLWEDGSEVAAGALSRAASYLPSTRKLRAALPTTACSARLNATYLDPLLPDDPAWLGVKESLHDAWLGLKDHSLKGIGVLLAGGSRGDLRTAATAIARAVPVDCMHCFLHMKADGKLSEGGADVAGALQARLASHLKACPHAIVHIEAAQNLHVDVLPVLLAAMSEQGALTQDGKQIPGFKAIYIGTTLVPPEVLEKTDEAEFAAAVKKDLVFQLEVAADPRQLIVPEAFRRRWDVVAPIRKSSSIL